MADPECKETKIFTDSNGVVWELRRVEHPPSWVEIRFRNGGAIFTEKKWDFSRTLSMQEREKKFNELCALIGKHMHLGGEHV